MTKTIRITMTSNGYARDFDLLDSVGSANAKHNGGKLVIATLDDESELDEAKGLLDDSNKVDSYVVS